MNMKKERKVHFIFGILGGVPDRGIEGDIPQTRCQPNGFYMRDGNFTDDWSKVTCNPCLKKRRAAEIRKITLFKKCPKCGYEEPKPIDKFL
jgi:hypothetical protein